VPGDEHRHDERLARPRRHLERDALEARVLRLVRFAEPVLDPRVAVPRRDLAEVDRGLECFDLAEEEPSLAVGRPPVVEQPARNRRDARVVASAPQGDALADAVDELVRLDPLRDPVSGKRELRALLLRRRDRDEVRADPSRLDDLVRDPVLGEPEVARGLDERRVDDGVLDDGRRQ
jgi:hypothetical protein